MAWQRLSRRQHREVKEAVEVAEKATGLQFCVYLGPTEADVRAHAEALFSDAGLHQRPSVLIMVTPKYRQVEILTGPDVRSRIDDAACAGAVTTMTEHFGRKELAHGIIAGIRELAAAAGPAPTSASPAATDLPDVIDEE